MEDDGRQGLCAGAGMRKLLSRRAGCDEKDRDVEIPEARGDGIIPD